MGKVTSKGWQLTADDAPQPTGIIFEGSLRKHLGRYGASDERQQQFAELGDDLVLGPKPKPREKE